MAIKIGINGFGRIGRCVARIVAERKDVELVAINDLTSPEQQVHLFKYDSVHGRFKGELKFEDGHLHINDQKVRVTAERDPSKIDWSAVGADYVLECTGVFRKREDAAKHLAGGAKFVLVSAPGKGLDMTFVMGVNHEKFDPKFEIIDVASCTTNCLAPVAKVLNDTFGIEHGLMTTIHSYTNDQGLLDAPHKDFRRARAGAINMVPTTTGAAIAVTRALPELEGKLDGMAVRVPTPDGSCVDLVVKTREKVTVEEINAAIKKASEEGPLKGILGYTEDPIVSTDIIGDPHSSIFDSKCTMVIGDHLAKILTWYDNEWGYSNRMVDALCYVDTIRK